LIELINNAERTIHVQAYSFTSQEITDALIKAYNRGLSVHVLIDRTSLTSRGSRVKQLIDNGIDVDVCHVPGIAHNKVLIVDEKGLYLQL
jgi:phospholipase D